MDNYIIKQQALINLLKRKLLEAEQTIAKKDDIIKCLKTQHKEAMHKANLFIKEFYKEKFL